MKVDNKVSMKIAELIANANTPRELIPLFEKYRIECFAKAQEVYDDRTVGYNVDHPPYEEMVYGPISLVTEIFKRSRRLAALLSPMRTEPLRGSDINRMLDICVDQMNYLSWTYALIILATGFQGNIQSDDAPDYIGVKDMDKGDGAITPVMYNKDGSIRKKKGRKPGYKINSKTKGTKNVAAN